MKKIIKSEREWQNQLSTLAYQVTRESATEKPFMDHGFPNAPGLYKCVCCGAELFDSKTKFDSGSGWPSFFDTVNQSGIKNKLDKSFSMVRTEVSCNRCDAHLGHVFPDGPKPTGLRYCINGVALTFCRK